MTRSPKKQLAPEEKGSARQAEEPVTVVGIGASAGGLEALELFLRNVPADSGMAYAVIQHQDPDHKGILVELLQRATKMKVSQVRDRMRVEPDHVYVIPPNSDLSILKGKFHLLRPSAARGLRLPIDFFFRALADDRQERAVGVILSGMGSDGTAGLRAIKEKAGVALVQEPSTARFDGMPRSAVDAGLADIVAPAEELPAKILGYIHHVPLQARPDRSLDDKSKSFLDKTVLLLRAKTGHDFSLYKKSTIYRRIERRMAIHQIEGIGNYFRYLQENGPEVGLLFKELLIGVTRFFRDPEAWAKLKTEALPRLFENRPAGAALRAWVPGCSTGEEAYSLAIVFKEALEESGSHGAFSLQIFATDLDREAIDKARQGGYPANIEADVTPERLKRFFLREDNAYRVKKEIREMVIFAPQNLIMDPPFTKLDILTCRNLLIYLEPELQKKILPHFHYSLNPGGILLLGSAESVSGFTNLFATLDIKARIFQRIESVSEKGTLAFPPLLNRTAREPAGAAPAAKPALNVQALADQLILQKFAPPAVVVNGEGDILYVSGRTGNFLEPAAGKANLNVFAMAREGLRHELPGAFRKIRKDGGALTLPAMKVRHDGGEYAVDVTLQSVDEGRGRRELYLILFHRRPAEAKETGKGRTGGRTEGSQQAKELQRELRQARDELQTLREEMQSSQEELKSSNEELQSTNEELQSTNEELTTSREEMQSLNEELQTLNAELQAKVDELSRSNNDMKNLLNSTDIATVFLDDSLNVRRFTAQAVNIIKLISTDVGRPLTDISSALHYPELVEDAGEVLRTLAFSEKQVPTRDGRWFTVRIMPYRTLENRIDGLVLTFVDITVSKKLEEELRKAHRDIEAKMALKEDAFAKGAARRDEGSAKGSAKSSVAGKPAGRRKGRQEKP